MTDRDGRLTFGTEQPLPSTWAVLPSEAAKRPGVVTVTNAAGVPIATIDPVTRQRRTVAGWVEATLTPQGWARPMHDTAGVAFRTRERVYAPDYEPGRSRRDKDPRTSKEPSKSSMRAS